MHTDNKIIHSKEEDGSVFVCERHPRRFFILLLLHLDYEEEESEEENDGRTR